MPKDFSACSASSAFKRRIFSQALKPDITYGAANTDGSRIVNSLTFGLVTGESAWFWWTIAAAIGVVGLLGWWVWLKGRPFAPGEVFRASRLSKGNHLFPTQVLISPTSVVQYTPHWIGRQEESVHMAHIASVKIETKLLFSNVFIETSGGADSIVCHGHRKQDAVQMKTLIERYQTDYYRGGLRR